MRGVGLGQGLVFSTSGANIAYALDQRTGAIVWQTPLLNEPQHGLSHPESSPPRPPTSTGSSTSA